MHAVRLACFGVCLALVVLVGRSAHVQAQSDASAVLLPPAAIPFTRSRPATPRANFDAPNPAPRPEMLDSRAPTSDQNALVAPPTPAPDVASPPPRLADPAVIDSEITQPDSPAVADTDRPLPPNPTPRSALIRHAATEVGETDDQEQEDTAMTPSSNPAPEPVIDLACHQTLQALGAVFEPRGRVEGAGQCGIDDAVALRAIGSIDLQPAALITCPTAATFTAFVQQTISPQATQTMGSAPSTIYIAASYACRGRNNVPGARISEHGFGRAVDVRAIDMEDGQNWHVQPHEAGSEEPAARFQAALREESCGPFNTVLGPGSDGHHTDHLHFDTARRSSSYCR